MLSITDLKIAVIDLEYMKLMSPLHMSQYRTVYEQLQ